MNSLDQVRLNFSADSLLWLNVILAVIMFGVALDLRWADFIRLRHTPLAAITGLVAQFILLPLVTFGLVNLWQPAPGLALGMFMVAACPGGNISNFFTHLSRGNVALSVSLTAVGTVLAIVTTPLNFRIYASLYEPTHALLREISLDPQEMFLSVATLAGIPLILGMAVNHYYPKAALRLSRGVKPFSILVFISFVLLAFLNNYSFFIEYIDEVALLVFWHNLLALSTGYLASRVTGLNLADQKTITIETGIQNSGLGLLLIFSFFDGLGGMALIAAWWGIWHILSGLALATVWKLRRKAEVVA